MSPQEVARRTQEYKDARHDLMRAGGKVTKAQLDRVDDALRAYLQIAVESSKARETSS